MPPMGLCFSFSGVSLMGMSWRTSKHLLAWDFRSWIINPRDLDLGILHGLFTFQEKRMARNKFVPACDGALGNFYCCSWCQVTNVTKHLCATGVSLCFAFLTFQVSSNGILSFLPQIVRAHV